ncbi:MAG: TetR/AcrR family transcriptional regulator [Anaerolineae bacterium]|nr:TetR/AcrR family transcriptional regulator [Anaerolineae bacterium]NUQ04621.1 TetR family transcriptional regulator [Anaerolineae bacterium]
MMDEKKPDRRVIRTRRTLHRALLELIAERGYDAVSVADIAERAELRRATFYLHYHDKEALLMAALEGVLDDLFAQLAAAVNEAEAWRILFAHLAARRRLYRDLFTGQSAAAVARRCFERLDARMPTAITPDDMPSGALAGAVVGLIGWWLESGSSATVEDMAALAQRITTR